MFILNFKVNGNLISKILFFFMIIIILIIFSLGVYLIFFKNKDNEEIITVSDTIKADEIFEITTDNYTDILKAVNEDIDSYVGCKLQFSGYIYRLIDFKENQFVLARDMVVSENSQTLIVGFLCEYDSAIDFEDYSWVSVTGEITKGDFNGEIPILKITSMEKCDEPTDLYVYPPDGTYIPTSNMF